MIKDVQLAKENYKPVGSEMSTADILESLRLERIEDPNYYNYTEERKEEHNSAEVDQNDQECLCSESVSNCNIPLSDSDDMESITNDNFISYHKRVCQKSLLDIKNSLPRYNRWLPKNNFSKQFLWFLGKKIN